MKKKYVKGNQCNQCSGVYPEVMSICQTCDTQHYRYADYSEASLKQSKLQLICSGEILIEGEITNLKDWSDKVLDTHRVMNPTLMMAWNPWGDLLLNIDTDDDFTEDNKPVSVPLETRASSINIEEIKKITLDSSDALMVKLPAGTDPQDALLTYQHICEVLKTNRVLVFIGDVELSKVEFPKTTIHPLY